MPVGKIKLGMHVVEASGQVGVVSGWKVVPGVKVMYNLEVAQDHTFVVGMGMWVVHNCGITGRPDPQYVDITEGLLWATRMLNAISGKDGVLFISCRLGNAPTFDGDMLLISLH